jgi:peptidoglycan/LPS O-acetylase OafA/YrhL
VLFFHYRHFAHAAAAGAIDRDAVPFHTMLWPLYEYGLYGVQVFWGISGYIFFWKYGTAIRSGAVAARDFFWLRFSRLYPLHIATLIGVIGLQAIHRQVAGVDFVYPASDPEMFVRQLFLATDWAEQSPFSFNGPIWSISAEVAVYAAFFVLLRLIAPSMKLCIGVIVACLLAQMAGLKWVSIGCASYFFAGGLAALAPREWRRPAGALLFILILAGVTTGILADRGKLPTILLIAVPCLLMLASRGWNGLDRWQGPIQAAGNLTYSSYLLHFPLQLLVAIAATISGFALPLTNPLFVLAYIVGTLAVAAFSYRVFEVPLQDWLRKRTLKASTTA